MHSSQLSVLAHVTQAVVFGDFGDFGVSVAFTVAGRYTRRHSPPECNVVADFLALAENRAFFFFPHFQESDRRGEQPRRPAHRTRVETLIAGLMASNGASLPGDDAAAAGAPAPKRRPSSGIHLHSKHN